MALSLAACDGEAPAPPKHELAQVSTETVAPAPLAAVDELTGRIRAPRIAQVRARVPGIVLRQVFVEGREVKRGDVLFQIDPARLLVERDRAAAGLRKAQAVLAEGEGKLQRYRQLIRINAVSALEYEQVASNRQQAAADVDLARAALEKARLDLADATVTAPICGRIGRAQVTEGTLVGEGEATLMAQIQQLDPVYVDLTQSTVAFAALRRRLREAGAPAASQAARLIEEDGSAYPRVGRLLFSDINVDESSGQVVLRSEFPNPDGELLPGTFVRVQLERPLQAGVISVPQRAVSFDGAGQAQVQVVAADGTVANRLIATDGASAGRLIVSAGLVAGERVVVDGQQHLREGQRVAVAEPRLVAAPAAR
ncbi:efflux RND transporter periplasmic adaptor subunit [Pseudomonas sp. HR96]|uniref:efflux RND transporter periplasmic adaptor subunit n=1 Tax=Pseudomonas sp. HR96 TaxID=1027966 RepID=UPI0039BECB97